MPCSSSHAAVLCGPGQNNVALVEDTVEIYQKAGHPLFNVAAINGGGNPFVYLSRNAAVWIDTDGRCIEYQQWFGPDDCRAGLDRALSR